MIKIVFFDFDGVLTVDGAGSFTTCTNIQKHIPDIAFDNIIKCYRLNHPKMLLGQTTHASIWKEFSSCVGKDLDIEILDEAFRNTPMNTKMMELAKKLKNHYRLGIITDNSKERLNILKEEMKLSNLFEIIMVSGETGIRKDSDETFVKALELAGCKPEECVFIDNSEDNLIAPKKLGWNTIFHDHKKNDVDFVIGELSKLGVSGA
ncbi:MAG: HAD-superfamily hydrolase subfamily variant 3 [Candidatus Peribacteria bacterium]|nr:HAD-superfamily hydrolase subfamily variant 3 [Candidatus Peribacteria bacterium]